VQVGQRTDSTLRSHRVRLIAFALILTRLEQTFECSQTFTTGCLAVSCARSRNGGTYSP
jgi:hypothetical protein